MQPAGQDFLAGAALAEQHRRDIRRRHPFDQTAHLEHPSVPRDETGQRAALLDLEAPVVLLQVVEPQRTIEGQGQQFGLEGLGEEVVGAHAHRPDGVLAIVLAGEHDDLGVGRKGEDLAEQPETLGDVVRGRRQAEIHRHDSRLVAPELGDRFFPVAGNHRLVLIEGPAHLLLQRRIVLDDQ